MINRWMAVVLGAAVLAVPGTALAKGDHGKGSGKEKAKSHQKAEKKRGKKDKKAAKGKSFVFKGVYEGGGVVAVTSGNGRVRKGGFVGQDVTFDLSAAKLVVADSDGVPGITADDVKAGDKVLVQARLPRGTKAAGEAKASRDEEPAAEEAPAAFKARKLIVLSRPPVADDDSAEDDDAAADEAEEEQESEPEHVEEA